MILHTLTVPDDPAKLPHWLEQKLMAPDFGKFIAELSALFPETDPPRQLLDRWLSVALTDGLRPLPAEVLTHLLKHPRLLVTLQEQVALAGGPYWDTVWDNSDELRDPFQRGKQAIERILAKDIASSNGTGDTKAAHRVIRIAGPRASKKRRGGRGYKLWAIASTVVAAVLAVAVGLLAIRSPGEPRIPKVQIAWGWAKPNGLAADQSNPKDYLNKLAANVEEWLLHRPSDPTNLGIRIAEFRTGCTRLIHSQYGPLSQSDKAWLLEQCRGWAKELDGYLEALDGGADPLKVRAGVDETVRVAAATLRQRAQQLK
jgi:hypothetical protein